MTQPLQALARRVGHTFADEALLATAMRHRAGEKRVAESE